MKLQSHLNRPGAETGKCKQGRARGVVKTLVGSSCECELSEMNKCGSETWFLRLSMRPLCPSQDDHLSNSLTWLLRLYFTIVSRGSLIDSLVVLLGTWPAMSSSVYISEYFTVDANCWPCTLLVWLWLNTVYTCLLFVWIIFFLLCAVLDEEIYYYVPQFIDHWYRPVDRLILPLSLKIRLYMYRGNLSVHH